MRKILRYIQNFVKYIRKGGAVYVSVAQIAKGDMLSGKKILITGGSSGIGYSIAKKFLSEGARVLITGRNEDKLRDAVHSLGDGENISYLVWDIADVHMAKTKTANAVEILGGLDILVNNAGIYSVGDFSDIDVNDWDNIINTNLKGVCFICQNAVEYFLRYSNKEIVKKIINISSIRGFQGDYHPYGISKWGINGLTKGLAKKYVSENIVVNAIAPGITASSINGIDSKSNVFASNIGNGRVALPEEIVELALFLASDASNNIIGQIIICDGGATLI